MDSGRLMEDEYGNNVLDSAGRPVHEPQPDLWGSLPSRMHVAVLEVRAEIQLSACPVGG